MKPKKLTFKPAERNRRTGHVRVQLKAFPDGPKVRKWNYQTKRWSRWAAM